MKSAKYLAWIIFGLFTLFSVSGSAQTRIAVLDFELNDVTLLPWAPEELERTASVAPFAASGIGEKRRL